MNERLITISFTAVDPDETAALSTLVFYQTTVIDMSIVGVSVAPFEDDAGATVDIDDDGTNVISGIDASDANVPGTWLATGFGGTNDPVFVAAGSKLALDFNSAAAANAFLVVIYAVTGSATA